MHKIIFRTDGNAEIGLGHLYRCFALAEMLKNDFEITFCCIQIPADLVNYFQTNTYKIDMIKNDSDMFKIISLSSLIILDGYQFTSSFQSELKTKGYKLVCIDDLHDRYFYADLIINHAPLVDESMYQCKQYTDFALGVDYALLRQQFLKAARQKRWVNNLDTVFICFGGSDKKNLSLEVLKACSENLKFKKIIIVTGTSYQFLESITQIIDNDRRITHKHAANEFEMIDLLKLSDMAIVPSSGILFEVLAAGCLVASGYYIDNQKDIYHGFKKLNTFFDLGGFENLDALKSIQLSDFTHINRNLIDGLSSIRLNNKIKSLFS